MRPAEQYRQHASNAYERYMALQAKIVETERAAIEAFGAMAEHRLKVDEQYYKYRQMCADRDMLMRIANTNALMAAIAPEVTVRVAPLQREEVA